MQTLSQSETIELNCPRCGRPFEVQTWVVVDGNERPDLVAGVLNDTLHNVTCPACGYAGAVPSPLLYHDAAAARVLLAVPPGMPEAEWREAGQTLLWSLIGALPESHRLSYLGELQAEMGLVGIAGVIRRERLAGSGAADETPPLVLAVEALLHAATPAQLQQVLKDHSLLVDPQAITILRELAHAAYQQDEPDAGAGFTRAADLLVELGALAAATPPTTAGAVAVAAVGDEDPLDELAFAILRTRSGADLAAVVDLYPELLQDHSDQSLSDWAVRTRTAGKTRMADGMDERRRALAEMRAQYHRDRPVLDAVQQLLEALTPADVEAVILTYDELLTLAADDILTRLIDGADASTAALIVERRDLLRRVSNLLHDPPVA
ncbi:MAG: CpXC domain-containing protein [Herpetosiphon sp.]